MFIQTLTDCYLKRLNKNAKEPFKASESAAAYDLFACIDNPITIKPHQTVLIGTGWAIQPPKGFCVYIMARSGLATKKGLRPANCVGLCDWDYRGEYKVALHNDSEEAQTIQPNERIAQMMFVPFFSAEFKIVDELEDTERSAGGFGSTGR